MGIPTLTKLVNHFFPRRRIVVEKLTVRNGMTLDAWRKSDLHITGFRELWQDAILQDAVAVLKNAMPAGPSLHDSRVTDIQAAIELGRIQGYATALSLFQSLLDTPTQPVEPPEADFGADEILKQQQY